MHQQLVHGADIGEQGEEQHGECGSHDQVGHVNDRLEELLSPDIQPVTGEEDGQQQSDDDLGNGTAQPKHDGVAQVLQNVDGTVGVRGEELDVVGQAHEVGAYLLQAGSVIFKEAVVDGQKQGIQVENGIGNEKRCNEQITPLGVTDAFALGGIRQSFHSYILLAFFVFDSNYALSIL